MRTPRFMTAVWRTTRRTFLVGLAVWAVQFVLVLILVATGATWYPGIRLSGGEWDGWMGPGWIVGRTWCFGTWETCADTPAVQVLHFSLVGTIVTFIVWALLSRLAAGIIWKVRDRHRQA